MIGGSRLSYRVRDVPNGWTLVEIGEMGSPRSRRRIAKGLAWQDAAPEG
jgi:hypothetical protein